MSTPALSIREIRELDPNELEQVSAGWWSYSVQTAIIGGAFLAGMAGAIAGALIIGVAHECQQGYIDGCPVK